MRQLASIQKIESLEPIPNADRIEVATVLGWEAVVKKGDFKVGELCVYFEVDSILPPHEVFDFMQERRFRVKTIRLRKQISSGLVMPLSILLEFGITRYPRVGTDLTEKLGVKKHDPQLQKEQKLRKYKKRNPVLEWFLQFAWFRRIWHMFGNKRKTNFPEFISKSDENRVQNIPNVFRKNTRRVFYEMEKLDGQSGTYAYLQTKLKKFQPSFYVASRNITLYTKDNSNYWEMAEKYNIKEKLKSVGKNIAIQVEIIGPGIQKNKYNLKERTFRLFNVWDIDKQKYYNLDNKIKFCEEFGFKWCPIISTLVKFPKDYTVKDIIKDTNKFSYIDNTVLIEGFVIRDMCDDSFSFKAINPDFLILHEE